MWRCFLLRRDRDGGFEVMLTRRLILGAFARDCVEGVLGIIATWLLQPRSASQALAIGGGGNIDLADELGGIAERHEVAGLQRAGLGLDADRQRFSGSAMNFCVSAASATPAGLPPSITGVNCPTSRRPLGAQLVGRDGLLLGVIGERLVEQAAVDQRELDRGDARPRAAPACARRCRRRTAPDPTSVKFALSPTEPICAPSMVKVFSVNDLASAW